MDDYVVFKHCSTCKYYYCYNASMFCSHPSKQHKITAKRKNGCKFWEDDTKPTFRGNT